MSSRTVLIQMEITKEIWSGKEPGSAKSNNGKSNYPTRAQVPYIFKEHDTVKDKNAASKN